MTTSTIAAKATTMYKLAKKLGYWLVTLESNDQSVQCRSLSRKTCTDWIAANEPSKELNQAVGVTVWSARPTLAAA